MRYPSIRKSHFSELWRMADYGAGRMNTDSFWQGQQYVWKSKRRNQWTSELVRQRSTSKGRPWAYHNHLGVCLVSRREATKSTCSFQSASGRMDSNEAAASDDVINDTSKNGCGLITRRYIQRQSWILPPSSLLPSFPIFLISTGDKNIFKGKYIWKIVHINLNSNVVSWANLSLKERGW